MICKSFNNFALCNKGNITCHTKCYILYKIIIKVIRHKILYILYERDIRIGKKKKS